MSVFTPVSNDQLRQWLVNFPAGELLDLQGIPAGIDNSNFFVTTTKAKFVLTLFERLSEPEVDYYLSLMAFLSQKVPSAAPLADQQGNLYRMLNGKLAALIERLPGKNMLSPTVHECVEIGKALANLHLAGQEFSNHMPQPRGLSWCLDTAEQVKRFLSEVEHDELDTEVHYQQHMRYDGLPKGVVHADLFRDNVLFEDGKITGIIDFYFSGRGYLLYDVAIVINDWCLNADYTFDLARYQAVIDAYAAIRPFTPAEKTAWTSMLRLAALRFWLSRVYDKFLPRDGTMVHCHDPAHFRRVLQNHAQGLQPLPALP